MNSFNEKRNRAEGVSEFERIAGAFGLSRDRIREAMEAAARNNETKLLRADQGSGIAKISAFDNPDFFAY